ncbi:Translin-associated factor X-interacting protein 1 [Aphanomyces cochlioides]|nr:Translin-associated factor X-interacting protein 1 [Aphanomyces cochlioides]
MEVPLFKVHAELNVDLDEATVRLPPILSEPSKLFLASTKSVRLKATPSGAMTARERPKPDLIMRRTKRDVFMPVATQSLNHAQHEQLEHILHAFETDTAHHCLRPPDRLFWYFELLDQVAKTASPVQHVLQQIQRVLCDVVYDCAKLDVPRATRGLEFAHLVKQIHHDAIDNELARLEAAMKEQTKIQTSRAKELASLKAVLAKAKETQAKLLAEVAAQAESVRRDEEAYEHLLGDEVALDRKSSFHRLQLLEAAKMRGQVAEKAHALRDDFRKTMFFLHEKEAQAKEHDAIASTIDDLKREKAHLAAKSDKLTSDIQALEAQLAADQRLVANKREELRLAEVDLEEVNESSADLQRSHTPRPKWDAVFQTLPEVAYVDPVNQAASRDGKVRRRWAQQGRTQAFVKEMCHWLQRIQGDCGMSLQLARLTNESEAARLELSKLQAQVESLTRRQRRQVQALPTRGTGLGSISAVAKTLTAAKKLLGATAGFSNSTEPYTGPVKDFITALGTTPEVPQFLRHTGRVRNRHMTKTELEKIIRTTWSGKRAKEAHMGIKIPLVGCHVDRCVAHEPMQDDYLYEVLKTKFTIQTVIAEWGYNILHSLKAFSWDSEVELFFLCLTGAVSETIYDDQELMLDECRNVLLRLNESYFDAELKHDPKRVYLNDAMLTLHNFFPMKTPLQLKSIERELLREAKSKEMSVHGIAGEILIAIDELLPVKHRSSTRGYFLKVLRTQHFKEIQDYLALLDRKIREADVHNIGRVEIQSIKEAMQAIDVAVTDTWLADCILRGIPKRLVGHMGMTTIVEYRTFFKKMNLKLMKHSLNFFPKAQIVSLHSTPRTCSS